tara:strand:+ start:199 stop:447 length:249 start_codon:yes stop_codon:yes gene_type:complete
MEIPYVPEHWQNLTLEFTDEYKLRKKKKIIRIEKLNDISKSPKIMNKAPRKVVNDLKKPPEKYEYKYEPSECYDKRPHCVIL